MTENGNKEDIFAGIGTPPEKIESSEQSSTVAAQITNDVEIKAQRMKAELDAQQEAMIKQQNLTTKRIGDVVGFRLQTVLDGWFTPDLIAKASSDIALRKNLRLNVDSAAVYGVVPDNVVAQFIDSAATKATGQARLEVAKTLDVATGITRNISDDRGVSAEEVSKKAQKLLKIWRDTKVLEALFERLFRQTVNRVVDYQTRLQSVSQELAKKQVVLENVSTSMVVRQQMVIKSLYDTCVAGIALETILDRETKYLHELEEKKAQDTETPPQVWAEKIDDQMNLIQIITKRLVDEKAFAIKLIGLNSILRSTRKNIAAIKADVVFSRTNLMASLGIQLGLVVDMISTLRISKAAQDVRRAEAEAANQVGVGSQALNEAGNKSLLEVDTTIKSLHATVNAALMGIQNTKDNMQRVQEMTAKAESEFSNMFSQMSA
ncbi:MAG TPA: hypothetical protein PLI45_04590 [Candidatus Woesebacteria bacterium]|nr:hypothetical protein [Candidatus Woesebacteria bacterium]